MYVNEKMIPVETSRNQEMEYGGKQWRRGIQV
jgi:hypothetical protein